MNSLNSESMSPATSMLLMRGRTGGLLGREILLTRGFFPHRKCQFQLKTGPVMPNQARP